MPEESQSWTVEEVRAYLPRLRRILPLVRRATEISASSRGNGHWKAVDDASGEEPTVDYEEPDETSGALTVQGVLDELTQRGVVLRDAARGLVDFPSRQPSGRVVLFCWQLGEDDLEWWHLPEDGFAGRRPLPVPPGF